MNIEKIGKFIAECRKEKKLTQEQLVEKLGITVNQLVNGSVEYRCLNDTAIIFM